MDGLQPSRHSVGSVGYTFLRNIDKAWQVKGVDLPVCANLRHPLNNSMNIHIRTFFSMILAKPRYQKMPILSIMSLHGLRKYEKGVS